LEPELTLVVDVLYPLDELAAGLTALAEVFPTVPLRLHVESLGGVAKAVLDRTCRLGILGSLPFLPKGLERTLIGEVQLVAVTAPSHPLSAAERPITSEMVANHLQLVLTDRSELTEEREFAVLSPETWRVADLGAKHALLRQGFGWGYMPWPVVEKDLARGTLTELSLQKVLPRGGLLPLYAVYPQDEPPGPAGAWLVQRLRQNGRKRET
jgi:DNA-binding transcriptional LysR family regulator